MTESERFVLVWDASALVGYYVPEAARNARARDRARTIIDAVRHHRLTATNYIPDLVVAEVLATFDREHYSDWDTYVKRHYPNAGGHLNRRRYLSARERFRRDIHNGALFTQCELSRYHVLALDLISPVDRHRQFYRRTKSKTSKPKPMGAFDLLIGAMALQLARLHGSERFALLTADKRMGDILGKACPTLKSNTAEKLGLPARARELGFGEWRPGIYPRVIVLSNCKEQELEQFFKVWPLKTRKTRGRDPRA